MNKRFIQLASLALAIAGASPRMSQAADSCWAHPIQNPVNRRDQAYIGGCGDFFGNKDDICVYDADNYCPSESNNKTPLQTYSRTKIDALFASARAQSLATNTNATQQINQQVSALSTRVSAIENQITRDSLRTMVRELVQESMKQK
jgi:hypothetical protein